MNQGNLLTLEQAAAHLNLELWRVQSAVKIGALEARCIDGRTFVTRGGIEDYKQGALK